MALKFKYLSQAEIPSEHASLYVERDGAFVLDADGAVDRSKVDEFRANNVALQKQLADLNAKFDGIDPDAVKTLLAEKAQLEEQKLIKDGEVEKLVENRTKKILGEMEKRALTAEQSAATLSAQLLEGQIERHVVEAGTKLGLRASAIPDIKSRARSVFKISGGAISAVESAPEFDAIASEGGREVKMPFWKDLTATRQLPSDATTCPPNRGKATLL